MSPQTLQRFVVRMLFDPALVAQIYEQTPVPGLDEAGRAMLTAPDRRAWATDAYRRTRALTALLEEFPASAAQAGVAALDAYFSSENFHTVCQSRGSMALGFGSWVESLAGPVARLETSLATVRRPSAPAPGIGLSPRAAVVELPAGTLAQYQALRDQLGPSPVVALVQGQAGPMDVPASAEVEHLLIQASVEGEVSLTVATPSLAGLLQAADPAVPRQTLQAAARAQGAAPGEEDEIIDELLAEGLLVACDPLPGLRP